MANIIYYPHMRAHLYVLTATSLIAASFIATNNLLHVANPVSLTLLRFVLATTIYACLVYKRKRFFYRLKRIFWPCFFVCFFYVGYFLTQFWALETSTVVHLSTIYTMIPLVTSFFMWLFYRERLTPYRLLAYAIAMLATIMVIFDGDLGKLRSFSLNRGDYIFMLGVAMMALYTVSLKYLSQKGQADVISFAIMFSSCLWLFLAMLLFRYDFAWSSLRLGDWGYVAYLAIGTTIITIWLYQKAVTQLSPTTLMSYTYLSPSLSALMMLAFYGVPISANVVFAMLLCAGVTLLLQTKRFR